MTPHLRSGIYFVQPPSPSHNDPRVFVIYWPEETTWDDDAISSVKRNRVTFMRCRKNLHIKDVHQASINRYLTKIVDQLYCLISPDHASSLVWAGNVQEELEIDDVDDDHVGRMFTFEVTKTNEKKEDIVSRPGITVRSFFFQAP